MANYDAFISFSHQDKATADAACAALEARGLKCWIAPRDIPYGRNWGEGIMAGINQSRLMVLIFSSNANASSHVHREVERAVNRGMAVIPFRIENVAPARGLEYFLSLPNWLDAFTPPLEPYLRTLVSAVKALLDQPVEPHPQQQPPAVAAWNWRLIGVGAMAAALVLASSALVWRNVAAPPSVAPGPTAQPLGTKDVTVDFAGVDTASAPRFMVEAEPYLADADISITVSDREPRMSRIVLINTRALYEGKVIRRTVSRNMLTQINTENRPASFTLTFAEPVAAVSFIEPATPDLPSSGVTFPAWRAVALSESGAELSVARGLGGRFAGVPAKSYTLKAPGVEGITSVRFASDPSLNGMPFAAFGTILIEQMTLTRP
jgi:hypothetical protein